MLTVSSNGTPLPPRPKDIPIEELYLKQSIGFAIWNGRQGWDSAVYLMPFTRADAPEGVLRMLGGTAVPAPYSTLSPLVQSLIRIQEHFGIPLTEETAADSIPLHVLMSADIVVHQKIDQPSASSSAPNVETHALLPASDEFIDRFYAKLERVWLDQHDRLQTASGRPFNNIEDVHIMRHLLAQVQSEGPMQMVTCLNPEWHTGDYTPAHDLP